MEQFVSKSTFKAKALELCRQVESTGKELVITDHGKPVLKVIPYHHDPAEVLKSLRGSVLRYDDPCGDRRRGTSAISPHRPPAQISLSRGQ